MALLTLALFAHIAFDEPALSGLSGWPDGSLSSLACWKYHASRMRQQRMSLERSLCSKK